MRNPFENQDSDRSAIWEMLVERDITAFCNADWDMVAGDFIEEGFMGINGDRKPDPDQWRLTFPDLASYAEEWLRQAQRFTSTEWKDDPKTELHNLTSLTEIEIAKKTAIAHKKFDGKVTKADGSQDHLQWQTLYRCRKVNGQWKIAGFLGYLPYPFGTPKTAEEKKIVPAGASQHVTAGPYSPVLEVNPNRIVVISGQAALDNEGNVIGDTIEEQTRATLDNCQKQLTTAGCNMADVFKVNVYLTDLENWPRFNEVYKTYFPEPKPVRTAVQTPLLSTFLVEIELWAVK